MLSLGQIACFTTIYRNAGSRAEKRVSDLTLTERQRVLAEYDPRRVLKELPQEHWFKKDRESTELLRRLEGQDLTPLKKEPAIRDMVTFLEEVSERSAA